MIMMLQEYGGWQVQSTLIIICITVKQLWAFSAQWQHSFVLWVYAECFCASIWPHCLSVVKKVDVASPPLTFYIVYL